MENKFHSIFRFDGENFVTTASSKCFHDFTLGIAVYGNMALTTGSYFESDQDLAGKFKITIYHLNDQFKLKSVSSGKALH